MVICVWCWHHIMDMADKDGTEGRCPACRTSYIKEKIVETSDNLKVAEMSMEKKSKAKSKSKTSDGRKQLTSVRVVQRNLVYIMGLPLDLADEDLLQGKEYFAQYRKVMKVSISRTSVGHIQQFANDTCSVYITYSKEEEAVRCIQSVHGFTLNGRPLRACFGTIKYCHAWLRNAPCNNQDCLYLHEIGSHEVSFSKDEIISAYTRTRVQQIAGATYDPHPRSGSVLPPPADEFYPLLGIFFSPPNSSSGRSVDHTSFYTPAILGHPVTSGPSIQSIDSVKDKDESLNMSHNLVNSYDKFDRSRNLGLEREPIPVAETAIKKVCSDMPSLHPLSLNGALNAVTSCRDAFVSREHSELRSDEQSKVAGSANSEFEYDLLSFNFQRIKDPKVVTNFRVDPLTVNNKIADMGSSSNVDNIPLNSSAYTKNPASRFTKLDNGYNNSYMLSDGWKHAIDDVGESSIISNILSMDFNSWDDSSGSRDLAKLLGEAKNKQGTQGVSTSWKVQSSNQSRFSFAREDSEVPKSEPSLTNFGRALEDHHSFGNGFVSNGDYYLGKSNDLSPAKTSGNFANIHALGSNKSPGQLTLLTSGFSSISPPGFSGPAKAPPPGFSERIIYAYENEAQAELLMQRSLSAHNNQHHRHAEMSGNFSSHPDYYGSPINVSPFGQLSHPQSRNQVSNGNWDGWSELQGINDLSMAELLRSERMGINNLFNSYEDSKYRMAGSNNTYKSCSSLSRPQHKLKLINSRSRRLRFQTFKYCVLPSFYFYLNSCIYAVPKTRTTQSISNCFLAGY
ncbi:hypothetical protein DCAR_0205940 [Daucus carota subsp. sativus]|uniref:RRM domain-containing protein n=1 Tax=Daucus carota subsp. sativus TaxID=79200 RepID=A0AAF0WB69_DAUCS|nr:hypothetical protein DCAR_0205940 [Daucus carota subsp. sativus]